MVQPALYVGLRISSLPLRSKIMAPADAGMRGTASKSSPASAAGPPSRRVTASMPATAARSASPPARRRSCLRADSATLHPPLQVPSRYPDAWMAIPPREGDMRRIVSVLAALGTAGSIAAAGVAAAAPAAAAAQHPAACSSHWGTNAKHGGSNGTVRTPLLGVRAGQHGCFDRL